MKEELKTIEVSTTICNTEIHKNDRTIVTFISLLCLRYPMYPFISYLLRLRLPLFSHLEINNGLAEFTCV